jgi:hypothetical protein
LTTEPDELVRRGSRNLRARARQWWLSAAAIFAAAVVLGVAVPSDTVLAWCIGGAAVGVPAFAWAALRAGSARRGLRQGCPPVRAVGWVRSPDGANYAVFSRGVDPMVIEPEVVVRLPVRTLSARTLDAYLCGDVRPSRMRSVAILDEAGGVVGVGRVRGRENALKVWGRRHQRTPWYVPGESMNKAPSV